ncbi:hypothetical protein [Novosphingobium sp.]|uniref:hypothetical protein n=1 Tax=Novosphingobium sp. TaxID=1874826 RepID=UPI0035636B5A
MTLEAKQGTPPVDGRYVVYSFIPMRSIPGWTQPTIATWEGGRWHHRLPVEAWIGPLPIIHTSNLEYDL